MQKYIILLSWPSCSWKSTVSDTLFEKYPWIFRVKSDSIKRFISWYTPNLYVNNVTNMCFALCESAMQEWFSLLCEIRFTLDTYQALAEKYEYKIVTVNLEAPYEILEKRFSERVTAYKESWSKWYMNTDMGRFTSMYEKYMTDKIDATMSFDTSKVTVDETIKTIDNYIQE